MNAIFFFFSALHVNHNLETTANYIKSLSKQILTAGRAKNEIPQRANKAAQNLPYQVSGTASPYPTVVRVTWNVTT